MIAVAFFLVLFACGVFFHGRDAIRRQPGAIFATILATAAFSGTLFMAVS